MNKIKRLLWLLFPLLLCSSALAVPQRPSFNGSSFVVYGDGVPSFSDVSNSLDEFVQYSPRDSLGRVGVAVACVGPLHYNTGRESISGNTPTGFVNTQYEFVTGGTLYHRCHLIAHRLTSSGEYNENLFTGTAYLNFGAMYKIESQLAEYITRTGNHVLYRVTPDFAGDELVCRGLVIEAQSVEDEEISFCVYCFNVQPGVVIDYRTGESSLAQVAAVTPQPQEEPGLLLIADDVDAPEDMTRSTEPEVMHYILNTSKKIFHYPDCNSVRSMSEKNKKEFFGTREEVVAMGYQSCGACHP